MCKIRMSALVACIMATVYIAAPDHSSGQTRKKCFVNQKNGHTYCWDNSYRKYICITCTQVRDENYAPGDGTADTEPEYPDPAQKKLLR